MNTVQDADAMVWLEAMSNLRIPRFRSDVTAWHGHLPLAFFVMAATKPGVFVELGTHKGDSYCTFCQAVESASLPTRCFAVDTWQGDEHAGLYHEAVYQALKAYHDPVYGRFSQLMRCTFDDALQYFSDGVIDLLHIDGLHTYEAVKADFIKWLPKLSRRAVVLFHDIQVRERDFGVWRFWAELKAAYPTFETSISHGLGVVAIGQDVPEGLAPLFSDARVARAVSEFLSYAGSIIMESDALIAGKLQHDTAVTEKAPQRGHETVADPNTLFCQIYFGDHHGAFRETDSEKREITVDEDGSCFVDVAFLLRKSVASLRFDPVNSLARLQRLELSLSSFDGTVHRVIEDALMTLVSMVRHEDEWVCVGNDPQIIIPGLSFHQGDMVRIRYAIVSLKEPDVSATLEGWMKDLHQAVCSGEEKSRLTLEQLTVKEEQHARVLRDLQCQRMQLDTVQSALKQANQDLYLRVADIGRLEAMLHLAQSRRAEAETKVSDQVSSYQAALEQLERVQSELSAVLGTKGWRMLNVLRTLRKFLRHPALTSRKLYASYRQLGLRTTVHRVTDKLSRSTSTTGLIISYDHWQRNHELQFMRKSDEIIREIDSWAKRPLLSVVMPTYNSKTGWLQEAVSSLLSQPYHNWELIISDDHSPNMDTQDALKALSQLDERIRVLCNDQNRGISGNTNIALAATQGDLITFLDHDDILAPRALFEVVKAWNQNEFDILYSDEDKLGDAEYEDAFFKPDYSPDYLLSCNYFNHLTVYRKSVLERVGYLRSEFDGAQDYDLLLRATEIADTVTHVPHVLYHWRKVPGSTAASFDAKSYAHEAGRNAIAQALERRGQHGVVLDTGYPGHYRVDRELTDTPLVSIIIPMRDKPDVLRTCLDSIKKSSYQHLEILIVDNGSHEPATLAYLASLTDCRVLRYDIAFNYSRLNNWAAKEAKGEYLLFLNNDIEVITVDWIEQMLQHAQRPNVGVVGAKLLYPDGRIQHAGVVLGIGGVAGHSHKYFSRYSNGYYSCLVDIRNYSAVTAACMMVPATVFEQAGGFDEENLAVAFNDVDLCLRIREQGFLCVFTPYAELWHYESLTRGPKLNYHEIYYMQGRWQNWIQRDPYYHPMLSLTVEDFRFDPTRGMRGERTFRSLQESIVRSVRSTAGTSDMDELAEKAIHALSMVLVARPDLQDAFCNRDGAVDISGLLSWAREFGIEEEGCRELIAPYVAVLERF